MSLPIPEYKVLSKEEEQRLCLQVAQARTVREKLTELIVLKQHEREAIMDRNDDEESLLSDDDYYSEYYNEDTTGSLPLKYYLLEQHHQQSYLEQAEAQLLGETDYDDEAQALHTIVDWPLDETLLTSKELVQYDHELINDDDIVNHIGLQGGRAELSEILCAGALARDELIRSNLKLVASIARRFMRVAMKNKVGKAWQFYLDGWSRPGLHEAFQDGVEGLITAVERFEPERDLKFSTFATFWVTNFVRRSFQTASSGALRLPTNMHDTKVKFMALVKSYYDRNETPPPLATMAKQLNLSEKRLWTIIRVTRPLQSLDSFVTTTNPLAGSAGGALTDDLMDERENPEEEVDLSFLRQSLESVMASVLTPHERDLLRLRLGLDDGIDRSLNQVASLYDGRLTKNEVGLTEKAALRKLRSPAVLETYHLDEYFQNSNYG